MHDNQFTATGPPGDSGFEKAAFSTAEDDETQFEWGARVIARRCGVVGQTRGGGIAGVLGFGRVSQFGVLGVTFGPGAGLVGASVTTSSDLMNLNVPPASFSLDSMGIDRGSGTGVLGKSGSGFGVHGDSDRNTALRGTSRAGIGAHGDSHTSTGVFGFSRSGFGVHGNSEAGPGGVFESRNGAQVRLLPSEMASPEGRMGGAGGELLATAAPGPSGAVFRLWFCVRPGDAATAGWDLVAGSRPFPGATLSDGATGIHVQRVQMRLNLVFGTDLNGDGELGPITVEAVRAFQEQEGIAQTGAVDEDTWGRLFELS